MSRDRSESSWVCRIGRRDLAALWRIASQRYLLSDTTLEPRKAVDNHKNVTESLLMMGPMVSMLSTFIGVLYEAVVHLCVIGVPYLQAWF